MSDDVYILGIGIYTVVVIEFAELCGYNIKGLYHYNDSKTGEFFHDIPVLDSTPNLLKKDSLEGMNFILSMGDLAIKNQLFNTIKEKGGFFPNLIHPTALVSKKAIIGEGVIINAHSILQADTMIGDNTGISLKCNIVHNSIIGKSCYVAANATVGANAIIEDFAFIGQGAIIISGKNIKIKEWAVVGAGAVVSKDVESRTTVVGNPAKLIKK